MTSPWWHQLGLRLGDRHLSLNSTDLGSARPCRCNVESFNEDTSASHWATHSRKKSYLECQNQKDTQHSGVWSWAQVPRTCTPDMVLCITWHNCGTAASSQHAANTQCFSSALKGHRYSDKYHHTGPPKPLPAVSERTRLHQQLEASLDVFPRYFSKQGANEKLGSVSEQKLMSLKAACEETIFATLEYTTRSLISSGGRGNLCQPEPRDTIFNAQRLKVQGIPQMLFGSRRRTSFLPQQGRWLYKSIPS